MRYIADFHIHSRFSRATSPKLTLENINYWAQIKGVDIVSVADFTHPVWFKEIKQKLEEKKPGLYQLKKTYLKQGPSNKNLPYFIFTTEISCIYSQGGKVRRIHLLIFCPNIETAEKINKKLEQKGFNLKADGRPILGISAKELLKLILNICPNCFIVPAHCWTPWYALFGSKSGFDSVEECFEEESKNIFALETGLSSDIVMNKLWSKIDQYTLISNSDAHSGQNIGREATVFDLENPSYKEIIKAIKTKKGLVYTIEFFPEEGRYHFDGHRQCNVCLHPKQSKELNNLCPKCGLPLTIGVLHRIYDLADRQEPFISKSEPSFKYAIPLIEIIAQVFGINKNAKKVQEYYFDLIKKGENEFNILLDLKENELKKISPEITPFILALRENKVEKNPGYDGVYGEIKILAKQKEKIQKKMF